MTGNQNLYSQESWERAVGHFPLRGRTSEDLALLHRHWMWANQMREALDRLLVEGSMPQSDAMLAHRDFGFMFTWYGMLWTVIEACIDPKEGRVIDIRGDFRNDIDGISELLRKFRNAVFHVPRSGEYVDPRLLAFISKPDSVALVRRIHMGFGRLFLEEFARRKGDSDSDTVAG